MNIDSNTKKENIFDLTKLTPIVIQQEVKVDKEKKISLNEQNILLKDYIELPKNKWSDINIGDHIRYLRKDGLFRRGGFFKSSWVVQTGKNEGKQYIQLNTSLYNGKSWTVSYDDLDKIYIKNIIQNSRINTKNNESIEYLNKSIEQLKIDMLKCTNEQKRIINLIKKLHGIT